jgi:membrane protein implicated in regulation of membrane protease activity
MLSPTFWLILGTVFIIIEVSAIPGIGFLFAGLSAISLGGLITFGYINASTLADQIAYFFFITAIWWGVLWKPMKKLNRNKNGDYKNLSDAQGVVVEENGLMAGKVGSVKWSGTVMRARISPDSAHLKIEKGATVWIHEQKDGILLVDTAKHENKGE